METVEKQKFDVAEFCRKLRTSKRPPYKCPVAQCSKVYRSLCGLQHHLLTIDHDAASVATTPSTPGRKKGRWTKRTRSPATAQLLETPSVMSLTYAEAQNTVEFELDGRITRVNIHENLEVHSIGDTENGTTAEQPMETKPVEDTQLAVPSSTKPYYPEPLFRILDAYVIKDAPPMPSSYIRFVERPVEEVDADVEYEMDEQDCAWLDLINELRVSKGLGKVPVDTFELLMDRLEKESYFQVQKRNKPNEVEDAPMVDDDAVCCICMIGECQASNAILFCDMCNLAVHQDCYGVPYIPDGQWLCRRCLQSPSRAVRCILCPNKGGAFKQTDRGSWVHVVCAMWIPEVRFANPVFLEPVDSIELIPPARWKLTCYLCKKRGVGTCIQCHKTNCYMPFHVSCAQQAGLYMKMSKSYTGPAMDPGPISIQRTVYCGTHSPELVQNESLQIAESSSQSLKRPVNKKWFSTSISIPTIPLDRIQEIASLVNIDKKNQFILRVIAYWSLKRQLYNGVPLLRRLQISNTAHSLDPQQSVKNVKDVGQKDAVEITRLRQHMERARLLCELLRKRERLKAKLYRVKERCMELELQSFVCFLRRLWELIQAQDRYNIFSEPVDTAKVAGYAEMVKHPMDLSTMRKKLENFEYPTLDAFEEDFMLMINNCLSFNARDTVYFKAAVRMRNKCGVMISQARLDLNSSCIDLKTGMLLPPTAMSACNGVESNDDAASSSHEAPVTAHAQESKEFCTPTNIDKLNAQVTSVVERCKVQGVELPVGAVDQLRKEALFKGDKVKLQPTADDISQLQQLLGCAESLPGGPGRSKMIRAIKNQVKTARRKLTLSTSSRVNRGEHSKQKDAVARHGHSTCKKTDASAK